MHYYKNILYIIYKIIIYFLLLHISMVRNMAMMLLMILINNKEK